MISIDDIRDLALAIAGAEERSSYGGRPSWRNERRMFAWVREDPEALVVWVEDLEEKRAMVEGEPAKFFTTSHYDGEPIVLVRLAGVERDEAAELIEDSARLRS